MAYTFAEFNNPETWKKIKAQMLERQLAPAMKALETLEGKFGPMEPCSEHTRDQHAYCAQNKRYIIENGKLRCLDAAFSDMLDNGGGLYPRHPRIRGCH
jgi:hypothetical protein